MLLTMSMEKYMKGNGSKDVGYEPETLLKSLCLKHYEK